MTCLRTLQRLCIGGGLSQIRDLFCKDCLVGVFILVSLNFLRSDSIDFGVLQALQSCKILGAVIIPKAGSAEVFARRKLTTSLAMPLDA